MEWSSFYTTMAASSATVVGLVFVAAQLRYQKFSRKPIWDAVASSTFYMYFLVLILCLTFLMPGLGAWTKSAIILGHIGLGTYRVFRIWSGVWIAIFKHEEEGIYDALWFLAGPSVLYILLSYHAIMTFIVPPDNSLDTNIAIILLVIFGLALRNSWSLLMDRAFQKTIKEPKSAHRSVPPQSDS